jgi:hypothetical protein
MVFVVAFVAYRSTLRISAQLPMNPRRASDMHPALPSFGGFDDHPNADVAPAMPSSSLAGLAAFGMRLPCRPRRCRLASIPFDPHGFVHPEVHLAASKRMASKCRGLNTHELVCLKTIGAGRSTFGIHLPWRGLLVCYAPMSSLWRVASDVASKELHLSGRH